MWGWQSPFHAEHTRCWNTNCSAVLQAVPLARQSSRRHPSPSTGQGMQVRLLHQGQCVTHVPRNGQDLDQGFLLLMGQEHRDAMQGRGMHRAHGQGHLPSIYAPVLPVIIKAGGHWHHPAFQISVCDSMPKLVCQRRTSPCKPLPQQSCTCQARNWRELCSPCHMEPGWL